MLDETYSYRRGSIIRTVKAGALSAVSSLKVKRTADIPLAHQWWHEVLRGVQPEVDKVGAVHTVDFFCGSGGLSLGAKSAIEALGMKHVPLAAVDIDGEALAVYKRNFFAPLTLQASVGSLVDFHTYGRGERAELAYAPEIVDGRLSPLVGRVDLMLAGPPCQGHSNLNNHTRRDDPRNQLYVCIAALAVALRARMLVIENVPDVLSDKTDVVGTAKKVLGDNGYVVSDWVLSATELGAAQSRKRHFLVATGRAHVPLAEAAERLKREPMNLFQAIGDLQNVGATNFMDEVSELSGENQARIDYLFDNKLWDLPDKERPDCHKNGHTYPSVYGRLSWDKPSQTITTGFMTPGRGRYIHPSRRRVLTSREAARIQGFPDTFVFSHNGTVPSKKALSKWIGDAVPSWLGYYAVLTALSGY